MGITTKLAEDLYGIRSLSEKDTEQLHTLIIDFFAAAYAGFAVNRPFNDQVEAALLPQGCAEESYVFLQGRKMPAPAAAFLNAVYGHGAELDDGNRRAAGHAGVHLIPAVFALADKVGSTNEEVLTALAAGYEAYVRISSAAQPGLVERGFHSTGMAGTPASAAACAKLLGLTAAGIEEAMALATTMSSGLLSYGDSRPAMKPLNPGRAAESGVLAALLAKEGMRGPAEALEGPHGWFHAVTDKVDESALEGGEELLLHDCYVKLYPSCRHTHCGLDAAIAIHDQLDGRAIEDVEAVIYPKAIELAGIRDPRDQDDAKFSIPYTLAFGLLKGRYGIGDMDPAAADPAVLSLMEKIRLVPEPSLEDRAKGTRGARVTVTAADGSVFTETVRVPKGDPEQPLTRPEIIGKLKVCAAGQAEDEKLEKLVEAIEGIRGEAPFADPMALL